MAHVSGPTSSMPGSTHHNIPEGTMCDDHADRLAVHRVQGETDSMGAEYHDLCQECYDKFKLEINSVEARSGKCDYCSTFVTDLSHRRDPDEGMSGPVYRICGPCRDRCHKRDAEELEASGYDDYFDGWI